MKLRNTCRFFIGNYRSLFFDTDIKLLYFFFYSLDPTSWLRLDILAKPISDWWLSLLQSVISLGSFRIQDHFSDIKLVHCSYRTLLQHPTSRTAVNIGPNGTGLYCYRISGIILVTSNSCSIFIIQEGKAVRRFLKNYFKLEFRQLPLGFSDIHWYYNFTNGCSTKDFSNVHLNLCVFQSFLSA